MRARRGHRNEELSRSLIVPLVDIPRALAITDWHRARVAHRLCPVSRAPELGLPEESVHSFGASVLGRGAQTRERQMRQTPRDRRAEALQALALTGIQIAKLRRQSAGNFLSGDSLEFLTQIRKSPADRAGCELAAQPVQALID